VEAKLLALARPCITLIRLVSHVGDSVSQQRGYRGNAIAYPQPVHKLDNILPIAPKAVSEILRVSFVGKGKPDKRHTASILNVRVPVIRKALLWLKANNPLYEEIQIAEENLLAYENLDITDLVLEEMDSAHSRTEREGYVDEEEIMDGEATFIQCSGMIDVEGPHNQQRDLTISAAQGLNPSLLEIEGQTVLVMPRSRQPLCEYEDVELFARCYPLLYPYGVGCPGSLRRQREVSLQAHL